MTVIIERMDDRLILVNGKEVRQDMDGNWKSRRRMSVEEAKFFGEFVHLLKRPWGGKIRKAEYNPDK